MVKQYGENQDFISTSSIVSPKIWEGF